MNETLATYMIMAFTVLIMVTLVIGITFSALAEKKDIHEKNIQTEHQVKFK